MREAPISRIVVLQAREPTRELLASIFELCGVVKVGAEEAGRGGCAVPGGRELGSVRGIGLIEYEENVKAKNRLVKQNVRKEKKTQKRRGVIDIDMTLDPQPIYVRDAGNAYTPADIVPLKLITSHQPSSTVARSQREITRRAHVARTNLLHKARRVCTSDGVTSGSRVVILERILWTTRQSRNCG